MQGLFCAFFALPNGEKLIVESAPLVNPKMPISMKIFDFQKFIRQVGPQQPESSGPGLLKEWKKVLKN